MHLALANGMLPTGLVVNGGSGWVDTIDLHIQFCVYAQDYICEPSCRKASSSEEGDSIMCRRTRVFLEDRKGEIKRLYCYTIKSSLFMVTSLEQYKLENTIIHN